MGCAGRQKTWARVRFLTPDEEKKLRDAIRSEPPWVEHEVELDLVVATGLRRSSMYIGLVWEHVDLTAKTLTIPRTKNGDPITLPLNPDALRAIAIFPDPRKWQWPCGEECGWRDAAVMSS